METHIETVPLQGFPEFSISPDGKVYKNGKPKAILRKKGKSPKVQLTVNKRLYTFGLAKLIAQHFIPNPRKYTHVIFKDRDKTNCQKDNIAWVSGEVFLQYSYPDWHKGMKKKVYTREYAIERCKFLLIRAYYRTLNEQYIEEAWNYVCKRYENFYFWPDVMAECYIYFIDRIKRFSLFGDPAGLLWMYCKKIRSDLRKEISSKLPKSKLLLTDESLRNIRQID